MVVIPSIVNGASVVSSLQAKSTMLRNANDNNLKCFILHIYKC